MACSLHRPAKGFSNSSQWLVSSHNVSLGSASGGGCGCGGSVECVECEGEVGMWRLWILNVRGSGCVSVVHNSLKGEER